MLPFKKEEIYWIGLIFILLIVISAPNFVSSLRRARDVTRKNDLGAISVGLEQYFSDFGVYPASSTNGEIVACQKPGTTPTVDLVPCEWGKEPLIDQTPGSGKIYLSVIPVDPNSSKGVMYRYFSNGRRFQIFTALEGSDEPEFDSQVEARSIDCGEWICNMGRASSDGPINLSIEQWERQIEEARKRLESGIGN